MYQIAVFVHIIGATIWVGGVLFLALVAIPVTRQLEPTTRSTVIGEIGRRFRTLGWLTLTVMVLSGVYISAIRGATFENIFDGTFWSTPFGQALVPKLILVALMATVSAIHDFVVGPASQRALARGVPAPKLRRQAAWLARITALLALAVVFAGVLIVRPGLF